MFVTRVRIIAAMFAMPMIVATFAMRVAIIARKSAMPAVTATAIGASIATMITTASKTASAPIMPIAITGSGNAYQVRRLGRNDRIYRGSDNRYYCRRSDGTTGLIIGGLAGGLLGNSLAGGGSRTLGTLLGGGAGALLGQSIDRGSGSVPLI